MAGTWPVSQDGICKTSAFQEKFDVRDRARMEMEPQKNLSSVHRVGRAHCCGESREILVKADVSQVHLGK